VNGSDGQSQALATIAGSTVQGLLVSGTPTAEGAAEQPSRSFHVQPAYPGAQFRQWMVAASVRPVFVGSNGAPLHAQFARVADRPGGRTVGGQEALA
jgi:hypothetical protein